MPCYGRYGLLAGMRQLIRGVDLRVELDRFDRGALQAERLCAFTAAFAADALHLVAARQRVGVVLERDHSAYTRTAGRTSPPAALRVVWGSRGGSWQCAHRDRHGPKKYLSPLRRVPTRAEPSSRISITTSGRRLDDLPRRTRACSELTRGAACPDASPSRFPDAAVNPAQLHRAARAGRIRCRGSAGPD